MFPHRFLVGMTVASVLLLVATPTSAQNAMTQWVQKNKRDYRVRSSANSFNLVGYTYGNKELTPPPLARTTQCFGDPLKSELVKKDNQYVAKAEAKVITSRVKTTNLDAFLSITGKQLTQNETSDLKLQLEKESVEEIVIETGQVFEIILSSQDIRDSLTSACREIVEKNTNNWIVAQALGIDGASYYFAKKDGTKVAAKAALGKALAKFGLGKEGSEVQVVEYEQSIYFGYVAARYCPGTKDYRQRCN